MSGKKGKGEERLVIMRNPPPPALLPRPLAPWREVNEEVGRVGGHVGIFRSGGHASQGHGTASKPAPGEAAGSTRKEPAGQAPARSAPKAPAGGHQSH